jgi:hypothetical protein
MALAIWVWVNVDMPISPVDESKAMSRSSLLSAAGSVVFRLDESPTGTLIARSASDPISCAIMVSRSRARSWVSAGNGSPEM